jgi:hypothetical protein
MLGHELAVEQSVAADLQPRDQPGQRDLRRIAARREHAFAEKGGAEIDSVEAADERALVPAFDRMGVAALVEQAIASFDVGVDPGLLALGAAFHHFGEGGIAGHPILA